MTKLTLKNSQTDLEMLSVGFLLCCSRWVKCFLEGTSAAIYTFHASSQNEKKVFTLN